MTQPPHGYYPPPPPGYGYPPPAYPMIDKHLGWFIVNWLFFWPTAIYSLVAHWNKIDPLLFTGNVAEAQRHADAVRTHGIVSIVINVAIAVLVIFLFITVFSVASHCFQTRSC